MKQMFAIAAMAASLALPAAAAAQGSMTGGTEGGSMMGGAASMMGGEGRMPVSHTVASVSEGEVRKVDSAAGKLTLRHGTLENLDMPAMTMVFQVRDPAVLERVKTGDRIRFAADRVGGQYTVTHVESAK